MTNGHQLIATLPSDLPSPLAGKLAEITGCCYGIKQANHEFDKDLVTILTKAGFVPTPSHHSFHKRCPIDPAESLTLNMHVDDGWYVTCSPTLRDELKTILQQRFQRRIYRSRWSPFDKTFQSLLHSRPRNPHPQVPSSVWYGSRPPSPYTLHSQFLRPTN